MVKYELKKVFSKSLNKGLLVIIMVLAVVFSCFAIGSQHQQKDHPGYGLLDTTRQLVKEKQRWEGEVTPAVAEKITETAKKEGIYSRPANADLEELINSVLCGGGEYDGYKIETVTPTTARTLYSIRKSNLKKITTEYGKTKEQQLFLKEKYDKQVVPFYYKPADSWKAMYLYVETYGLVLILFIGVLAAGIFANEFRWKTDTVLFSTKHGRSKTVSAKIIAGLVTATAVYWMGIAILSLVAFSVMGVSGAGISALLEQPYQIYDLTFGQEYLLMAFCGYIGALLATAIAMAVAANSKSIVLASAIPVLLFCVSPFIGRLLPFKRFFQLTPDQLINLLNNIDVPHVYQIGETVFAQIPALVVLYCVLTVLLLPFVFKGYRKHVLQ